MNENKEKLNAKKIWIKVKNETKLRRKKKNRHWKIRW